jgi:hypothetical protein
MYLPMGGAPVIFSFESGKADSVLDPIPHGLNLC